MKAKQRSIQEEISITGVGLHSGEEVSIVLKPAEVNTGIIFRRIDLPNEEPIKVGPNTLVWDESVARCSVIRHGKAEVFTLEHLMAALSAFGIDNIIIDITGEEVPGMDGSSVDFVKAIEEAGVKEFNETKKYIELTETIEVEHNGSKIVIMPSDKLTVEYKLDYPHPLLKQTVEFEITDQVFKNEIAPCRTFCLEAEANYLREKGFGKGANYFNTLVISENGPIENQFRFPDECARHKLLDCIGDLYLIGRPLLGKVVSYKGGHAINAQLVKAIAQSINNLTDSESVQEDKSMSEKKKTMDVLEIQKVLPHRYPFLLVDRILDIEPGVRATGLKNVTRNEEFFQGHFPAQPVMPGVLMVEAMAQVSGVAALTQEGLTDKLFLFMSVDKVKFRKMVVPGDQLIMDVEVVRNRGRILQTRGVAKVDGEVVCEAEMMFSCV